MHEAPDPAIAARRRTPSTLARIPADALYAPVIIDDKSAYVIARARSANYIYRNLPVVIEDISVDGADQARLIEDLLDTPEWSSITPVQLAS